LAAGGYDAIWLLVFEPDTVSDTTQMPSARVEALWSSWRNLDVSPLSAAESVAKGVRVEDIESIKGLKEML
jgi:phosphomevalonate kinase